MGGRFIFRFIAGLMFAVGLTAPVLADSSSPLLAAYYDRQMAIVGGTVYAWGGDRALQRLRVKGAIQVGVGSKAFYVLTGEGALLEFWNNTRRSATLMTGVARIAAGSYGVLAIKADRSLWRIDGLSRNESKIADGVVAAAVGDGTNYYITEAGALFVKGRAHRGQYGDGKLSASDRFVQTASDVVQITAHTGHAILLKKNGAVMGTGGNIYGPVGRHGLGDKAVRWSEILTGARAIATGSSHTLAIRRDGALMAWGRGYGPRPVAVMAGVTAFAAGSATTIALKRDGSLWQWRPGRPPRKVLVK